MLSMGERWVAIDIAYSLMKIIVSLRFTMMVAFLLLAGRAEAQLDTNDRVILYCGQVCDGCTIPGNFPPYANSGRSLCVSYNGSYRYSGGDSSQFETDTIYYDFQVGGDHYRGWGIQFNVDTTNKYFRNLIIRHAQNYYAEYEVGGTDGISIRFDSLPFIDSSGILLARGIFPCTYFFSTFIQGDWHNVGSYNSSCSDSGQTMDTVSLEIAPSEYLSVTQNGSSPVVSHLYLSVDREGMLLSSFLPSNYPRNLEIIDLLGKTVVSLSIPSGIESLQYFLPRSGCYFARLGDQVAKFIIPPR
jgi:hypothetical protein